MKATTRRRINFATSAVLWLTLPTAGVLVGWSAVIASGFAIILLGVWSAARGRL